MRDVDRRRSPRSACSAAMSARICTRSFASRFESGSSIRNTLGWRTIARPIATRWRWPPESWAGLRCEELARARAARPPRATRASRSAFLTPAILSGKAMFCRDGQVRVERVVLEDHRDVALLRRQVGDVAVADEDAPASTSSRPASMRSAVVLPEPGRADQHHELAVLDVEVERVDRRRVGAGVDASSPARSGRQPSGVLPLRRDGASSSSRARACASAVGADRVQRRAARRRRSAATPARRTRDLRRRPPQPVLDRARRSGRRRPAGAPPPSSTSTGSSVELEPLERDARERDDLAPGARRSRPRPRRRAASAKTTGGSSSRRRAGSCRGGSPRPARAASQPEVRGHRSARATSAGRGRPGCARPPRAPRGRRRSRRPSRR